MSGWIGLHLTTVQFSRPGFREGWHSDSLSLWDSKWSRIASPLTALTTEKLCRIQKVNRPFLIPLRFQN